MLLISSSGHNFDIRVDIQEFDIVYYTKWKERFFRDVDIASGNLYSYIWMLSFSSLLADSMYGCNDVEVFETSRSPKIEMGIKNLYFL